VLLLLRYVIRHWRKGFEAHSPQYKSIRNEPLKEQLELARQEWLDRFMKDDGKDSGVPAVLVATNVPQSWTPHESIGGTCLLLTEDGNLFVTKVSSPAHGVARGGLTGRIGAYCEATQTSDFILAAIAARKRLAGCSSFSFFLFLFVLLVCLPLLFFVQLTRCHVRTRPDIVSYVLLG